MTLSPTASRVTALGLLGIAIALAWLLLQPVLQVAFGGREELAQLSRLVVATRHAAALKPRLEAQLAEVREGARVASFLIEGPNEALAGANLQLTVKGLIEGAVGQVRSMTPLPTANEGDFRRVAVRVEASLSIEGLRSVLHQIETSVPLLFVDGLAIRARDDLARNDRHLAVRLDVHGYLAAGS